MVDRQLLNHIHASTDKSLADRIEEDHDHSRMLGQLVDDRLNIERILESPCADTITPGTRGVLQQHRQ